MTRSFLFRIRRIPGRPPLEQPRKHLPTAALAPASDQPPKTDHRPLHALPEHRTLTLACCSILITLATVVREMPVSTGASPASIPNSHYALENQRPAGDWPPAGLQPASHAVDTTVTAAGVQVHYVPTGDSRLWINGRSNVHDFTCEAGNIDGFARLDDPVSPGNEREAPAYPSQGEIQVEIPVASFDCGRERMNRDFREALLADQHERITFQYQALEQLEALDDTTYRITIAGSLSVAGTTRKISTAARGYRLDSDHLRVEGSTRLSMEDFNVEPPTALMGLVRVDDTLRVHYDLLARPEEQ